MKAVLIQIKVVTVRTKGILNFSANRRKTKDDVRGDKGTGDSDPAQFLVQLERQDHHVQPGDLRDGDAVSKRERSVEDAIAADICIRHGVESDVELALHHRIIEEFRFGDHGAVGPLADGVEDLVREISMVDSNAGGALVGCFRIPGEHRNSEILAPGGAPRNVLVVYLGINVLSVGLLRKSVQRLNEIFEIFLQIRLVWKKNYGEGKVRSHIRAHGGAYA